MYVCLCHGVTSREVAEAVADGACTSNQVAAMCGAGSDCGRCRRTVQSIIAAANDTNDSRTAECTPLHPRPTTSACTPLHGRTVAIARPA
nr:(2Fe-2S)-binding protein [Aldersonia kunmingensis]